MGLDITAYSRMERVDCDSRDCELDGHVNPYINPDFPEQANGVSGCYRKTPASKEHGFRAGSYGGYNWWRDELAQMVSGLSAFSEMIMFSDCEGTIGPNTSRKLAADFGIFQELADARKDDDTMFTAKYQEWRKAFEIAQDGGFVRFH
jgi:hypothetical protein